MGDHEIDRIDLKKMEYTDKIPVGGIPRPYAVTKDEKTLYVALSDYHGFEIVNIPDKKEIARVDLPAAPPADCALEPHTETHGLALSPNEKELWVTSLSDNGVYVYDIATKKLSKEISDRRVPELDRVFTRRQVCDREQLREQRRDDHRRQIARSGRHRENRGRTQEAAGHGGAGVVGVLRKRPRVVFRRSEESLFGLSPSKERLGTQRPGMTVLLDLFRSLRTCQNHSTMRKQQFNSGWRYSFLREFSPWK